MFQLLQPGFVATAGGNQPLTIQPEQNGFNKLHHDFQDFEYRNQKKLEQQRISPFQILIRHAKLNPGISVACITLSIKDGLFIDKRRTFY